MGLKEMVAQLQQTDNAGSGFNSLVQGFEGGIATGRTNANESAKHAMEMTKYGMEYQNKGVERALKLLEFQQKLKEAATAEANQKTILGMMKGEGIIPLDPAEQDVARKTAWSGIAGETPSVNTEMGKMQKLYGTSKKVFHLGEKGFSMDITTGDQTGKTLTPNEGRSWQEKIYKMAEDMGRNQLIDEGMAAGTFNSGIDDPKQVFVPEDLTHQYLSTAEDYLKGNKSGYEAKRNQMRRSRRSALDTPALAPEEPKAPGRMTRLWQTIFNK
jgi:hypothetical protein